MATAPSTIIRTTDINEELLARANTVAADHFFKKENGAGSKYNRRQILSAVKGEPVDPDSLQAAVDTVDAEITEIRRQQRCKGLAAHVKWALDQSWFRRFSEECTDVANAIT